MYIETKNTFLGGHTLFSSRIPLTILAAASADDVNMACIINKNPVEWMEGQKIIVVYPDKVYYRPSHAYGFL